MDTPEAQPQTRVGRAPFVVAGVVLLVTAALLVRPDVVLSQEASVLPGFYILVVVFDLLTAIVLVEHYRSGGGPRSLALSWAYSFAAAVVTIHALVFPGLASETGLFGALPSSAPWLWVAWHIGFPFFLGLALVPWPARFHRWASRPDHRLRRTATTHGAVLAAVTALGLLATVGADRLPFIIDGTDYSVLSLTYGPWIAAVNVLALIIAVAGIVSRPHSRRGVETWALVAVVATACDAGLMLLGESRFTTGWYGARVMAVTAAMVVLLSMLMEASRLHRQMREYADRLAAQNEDLLEAQALRDHLIAVVTHEMRTPLGGLRGYLEVLQDGDLNGPLPAEMKGQLPTAVRRAQGRCLMLTQRLTLLTEDLLAVATAQHGGLAIRPENADLANELSVCAAGFPDLDLRIECPARLTVFVDPLRLQQVLANLVGNAAKYGAAPVTLHAGVSNAMALIEVSDAGEGVPEDFIPFLFDRYSRAAGTNASGSGLGLSVVRDLLNLHGGSITYAPEHHVFEVLLPLAKSAPKPQDVVPVRPVADVLPRNT